MVPDLLDPGRKVVGGNLALPIEERSARGRSGTRSDPPPCARVMGFALPAPPRGRTLLLVKYSVNLIGRSPARGEESAMTRATLDDRSASAPTPLPRPI